MFTTYEKHKGLAGVNLAGLEIHTPEQLQTHAVTAVVLALGSNYHADYYLPDARGKLATFGRMQLSTSFQNPDFTATQEQPKPDYTNQCAYLSLDTAMSLQELQQAFKLIESDCHRQRLTEGQTSIKKVTMDIDILLIQTGLNKNSLSNKSISAKIVEYSEQWIIMADRYPFKAHETAGVEELISKSGLIG
ncbi:2-amino-4-hydroxy-6-hydroxymethyldihydropteridine diphosphokinase [Psychrobacter halodurans]|uniref:2-amino-4-hydroxy-6-hydroxymethyldihydropteridine diphosphokinase n=1 Tax=Psychrobacter halodurans TaxID=2818439 RepID=A0AAW4IS12_9GAMM|nr:2-amino-4-hydroxy-6-hydroxymethyldihydropteridine diphosphokinase [Psychrobacter halodurans]MBO1517571.1 2-amino-4-hydroxy-6-hydroxymethyldihydropteridine diphosphokinase [Psychrobacter halodurans]